MKAQTSSKHSHTRLNRAEHVSLKIALSAVFLAVSAVNANSYIGVEVTPREDISVIGDLMRSEESASTFFNMVDRDGDGKLRAPEVAKFLRESIGGINFDEAAEVDNEVSRVMKRLDQNHDDSLDHSDVLAHWTHLESLLTVDEVAEWVVYAVQLPDYIGKIFRENVVTGYDFPELVENGGKSLETDLGITKSNFRRKIVRLVQARMLGIGSTPTNPQNIAYTVESCSSVHFTWEKSTSRGFPIHSYRLQRRAVGGNYNSIVNGSTDNEKNTCKTFGSAPDEILVPDTKNSSTSKDSLELQIGQNHLGYKESLQTMINSSSEWQVIDVGSETEFVDSSLENGVEYSYRIQAWNSVGRSGWAKIDFRDPWRKRNCLNTQTVNNMLHGNRLLSQSDEKEDSNSSLWKMPVTIVKYSWVVVNFFANITRILMSLMALIVTVMKYKRATVESTYTSIDPICPWFFKRINNFSLRCIGIEIIPKALTGDDSLSRSSSNIHDKTVNAVGLNGYNPVQQQRTFTRTKSMEPPTSSPKEISVRKYCSERPEKVIQSRIKWKFPRKNTLIKFNNMETSMRSLLSDPSEVEGEKSSSSSSTNLSAKENLYCLDDMKFCSICQKKYKFPKRFRHHCSRCTATFCHKDGKTTHSSLVACGVPGTCLCHACLQEEVRQ